MKQAKFDTFKSDDEVYEHKNKLRKEMVNDAEFMNYLKTIDVDIDKFDGFLSVIHDVYISRNNCRFCTGLDNCKNDTEGTTAFLRKDNDYLSKVYHKCPYRIKQEAYENAFIDRDFDEQYQKLSISYMKDILKGNVLREKVVNALLARLNGNKKWLYISGIMNSDKTRFVTAFCNDYVKAHKDQKISFLKFSNLISNVSSSVFSNKEEFNRRYEELVNCEILVLDDFASGYVNTISRDMVIVPLLNDRAKKEKLTIFTSRYGIKDASERISAKDNITKTQILGLMSIMCENLKLQKEVI